VDSTFGPIDVWVNNAMVSVFSPVHEMTAEEYRRVTEVTYLGVVHGTLAALKRMRPRDRGTIVQVGSALAYRGIPLQSAYCAAKHAIQGFVDSLRCELLHDDSGVHVTMVQMPALNTPQFEWSRSRMPRRARPVPPIYAPEVGADAVVWASQARRREVWVGWSTSVAVLASRVAPGLSDHYLASTGYQSQQTDEPEHPGRCDNLFEPCPGDYAAEGRFSTREYHSSFQSWLSRHRGWVGLALTAVAVAAGSALRSAGKT
jgi:NAD(P)-dependent dehydrogenase (short-subunit alcohol dehydrogenase family)